MNSACSIALSALLSLSVLTACGKKTSSEGMPPPTGKGAPPRTELPSVAPAAAADRSRPAATERTTGTTYPLDRAEVSPDMSGVIAEVLVEEGARVGKGQVLFRMRTTEISLTVQQAEASLHSAQVALSAVKVEYDRVQRLLEQKATEQAQFDRIKAQYDGAAVAVDQAKVALAQARRRLNEASVRSPIDGLVTEVRKNAGEMATMMPVTVVVVIEDPSTLELRFRLPESALGAIKPGDTVAAVFEAIGAERTAQVDRISPAVDLRTRTFEVIATIDNKDGSLKSGMLAIVKLGAGGQPAAARRGD
jgi:RND family efflux transporter MFP subunit